MGRRWRVTCGFCDKRMWWRRWLRHQDRRHAGFAPFTLNPRKR